MTVITAIITRQCTVHASDSFITIPTTNGNYEVGESEETKIVRVPRFAGIVSYWGLAVHPAFGWNTLEWLRQRAGDADRFGSPEDFADSLRVELNGELSRMGILNAPDAGIGLHFTAYEKVNRRRVPELFRISNFVNTNYNSVFPDGFHCTRETYNRFTEDQAPLPEHRMANCRLQVYERLLHNDEMLVYNNGDPILFNPVAQAILTSLKEIKRRGALRNGNLLGTYRTLAKLVIDVVCDVQEKFVEEERTPVRATPRNSMLQGKRRIGGRRHALAVTPNGEYIPSTRD